MESWSLCPERPPGLKVRGFSQVWLSFLTACAGGHEARAYQRGGKPDQWFSTQGGWGELFKNSLISPTPRNSSLSGIEPWKLEGFFKPSRDYGPGTVLRTTEER